MDKLELEEKVKQSLDEGYTLDEIKEALVEDGYSKDLIHEIIEDVSNEKQQENVRNFDHNTNNDSASPRNSSKKEDQSKANNDQKYEESGESVSENSGRSSGFDIGGALKYGMTSENYIKNVVLGSLMAIGSILIIPMLIFGGYMYETVRNYSQGKDVPDFENFGYLLKRGAGGLAGFLLYTIPLYAGAFASIFLLGFPWGLAVGGLLYVVHIFLVMSVIYQISMNGFSGVTNVREIIETAASVRYILGQVILSLSYVAFGIVSGISSVTVVGPIVALYFYMVFVMALTSQACS